MKSLIMIGIIIYFIIYFILYAVVGIGLLKGYKKGMYPYKEYIRALVLNLFLLPVFAVKGIIVAQHVKRGVGTDDEAEMVSKGIDLWE